MKTKTSWCPNSKPLDFNISSKVTSETTEVERNCGERKKEVG